MPLKMFERPKGQLEEVKNILGVAAGKGGVGKSTVTVNLALALQNKGFKVGVMDTDIYGPSIKRMLPEDRLPLRRGDIIVPAICRGIKMISMAYFKAEGQAAVVRAPIANGLIQQFINQVEWGELDYLIIDFPPGTGDIQLTLAQKASLSAAIMVTTPQEVALMDVRKAMHLFRQVQIPVLGIVENMSYYLPQDNADPVYLFGRGGGLRLANESGMPLLAEVPIDPQISRCMDAGLSIFSEPMAARVASVFLELAEKTISHLNLIRDDSKGLLTQFELSWKQ